MEKYLEEIKSYLTILDEETINKELDNIKNVLLSKGKFEELNLVSPKEQASIILKSHNINPDIVLKKQKGIKNKFKEIGDAFNKYYE